jgi:hypothetical protein
MTHSRAGSRAHRDHHRDAGPAAPLNVNRHERDLPTPLSALESKHAGVTSRKETPANPPAPPPITHRDGGPAITSPGGARSSWADSSERRNTE